MEGDRSVGNEENVELVNCAFLMSRFLFWLSPAPPHDMVTAFGEIK